VANANAFGSGISYTRRLNSFQRSVKKHRNSDDVEISEVLTSTASATAIPSEQQPEVKAPAGETTVLIGLGFLFLATFRMMIVGF